MKSRLRLPPPPWPVLLITLIGLGLAGFQFFLAYQFYSNLKFSLGVSSLLNTGTDSLPYLQEGGRLFLGTLWSGSLLATVSLGLFFIYLSLATLLRLARERLDKDVDASPEDASGA